MEFVSYGETFIFDEEKHNNITSFNWFVDVLKNEKWEHLTFEIFNQLSNKEKIAVDIGGWIGVTSIFLSKKFKSVITIEPDLVAFNTLLENIKDNKCDNVIPYNKAFFNSSVKNIYFGVNDFDFDSYLGSSTSHIKVNKNNVEDYQIETISILDIIQEVNPFEIGLIKIDIEGGDEDILDEVITVGSKYGWKLWISFHYGWWKDKNIKRFEYLIPLIKKVRVDNTEIPPYNLLSLIEQNVSESFLIEL
jgi:FkbM family methyltransferase